MAKKKDKDELTKEEQQKVKEIADAIRKNNPKISDERKFQIAISVVKKMRG